MKYMVLVNGKFFVKIDVEGNKAAAEHSILDNLDGIIGAQAFDEKDMATEWFVRDWLLNNELISMDELESKTKEYSETWLEYSILKDEVQARQEEIDELNSKLMALKENQKRLESKLLNAFYDAKGAKDELNIRD